MLAATSPIWNQWLTKNQSLEYQNFTHLGFEEHADQRDMVIEQLRRVNENHHARSPDWLSALSAIGFPSLARAIQRDNRTFPSRQHRSQYATDAKQHDLTTRRGNFCEVLAAEYADTQMGFEVPVRRLRYNPNPDQSMKGDDVLGFRFPEICCSAAVLVGEAKFRSRHTRSEIAKAVEEAYSSLCRSLRSHPVSMDFVATILEAQQDHERAQWVRQMRAQLQSGNALAERHYLIVLGTLGKPDNPFAWLATQAHVMTNVTCVSIAFAPDIQSWLDKLFDGDA